MRELFSIILVFLSLNSFATSKDNLIGIWAMYPLKNGIANVIEFKSNGTSLLHPFNCAKPNEKNELEIFTYSINEKNNIIQLKSPSYSFDLKILELKLSTMRLEQKINDDINLSFDYLKMDNVHPLCKLYIGPVNAPPKTEYKESDFIPSPMIPSDKNINDYIGKWANNEGVTQIEISQNENGHAYLKTDSNENWTFLYNNVHWVNNELHYESYAYSKKETLYEHPFHKSQHSSIIKIISNNKMLYSFFIGKERYDIELTRE
ncbi:hypothetical protein EKN56_19605 [Limnobaculum zhutongyuii]|uniref:Uncharacterized protein n=1 Tax=Limnobaculum zhutongyuii TaxID=2498113 RepID=A0A411WQX3_9GAMM|nr:hypothetical protein [Limnobaculum zhutongyuii]QBH98405.1 hypothetical protein EKN56_19605 [Limnobaculum zhutongyuii]TQS89697.1 hypothetical protein ELQ32_04635 [Limnobaculum zhutongyuii]